VSVSVCVCVCVCVRAQELKEILKSRAVDFGDCYEKSDLVNKIKALKH